MLAWASERKTAKLTDPHPLFIQKAEKSGPTTLSNPEVGGSTNGTIAAVTRVGKLYKVVEQRGLKDTA